MEAPKLRSILLSVAALVLSAGIHSRAHSVEDGARDAMAVQAAGQQAIARDTTMLPLTAAEARIELSKLD